MSLRPFRYLEPESLEEAVSLLSEDGARALAGGSDLLSEMKEGVVSPAALVSLAGVEDLRGVEVTAEGVRIGAMSSLAALAADRELQQRYPVLAEAAGGIATPQIRNVGTLGGNLCQRPRCFYYRSPHTVCLKKGGDLCLALAGNSKYLCVLGGERCYIVHPSDIAVALVCLDADVELAGAAGKRVMPLQEFFVGPGISIEAENVLQSGEVVAGVRLPLLPEGAGSVYPQGAGAGGGGFRFGQRGGGFGRRRWAGELVSGDVGGRGSVPVSSGRYRGIPDGGWHVRCGWDFGGGGEAGGGGRDSVAGQWVQGGLSG